MFHQLLQHLPMFSSNSHSCFEFCGRNYRCLADMKLATAVCPDGQMHTHLNIILNAPQHWCCSKPEDIHRTSFPNPISRWGEQTVK